MGHHPPKTGTIGEVPHGRFCGRIELRSLKGARRELRGERIFRGAPHGPEVPSLKQQPDLNDFYQNWIEKKVPYGGKERGERRIGRKKRK